MYQCTTAAPPAQPPRLVSDVMMVAHRARCIAQREGVQVRPVQDAALSAFAAPDATILDAIRAAKTAAYGIAVLTGRA